MLVDLSHVAPETMKAALRVSEAPAIFSHSATRALCDVPRNVPDDVLRLLPKNGGVVMIPFVTGFLSPDAAKILMPAFEEFNARAKTLPPGGDRSALFKEIFEPLKVPPSTIAQVADHIEHVRDVAGVDHVGLGSDFDGNDNCPVGLADVSGYPNLFAELIRRVWSGRRTRKLRWKRASGSAADRGRREAPVGLASGLDRPHRGSRLVLESAREHPWTCREGSSSSRARAAESAAPRPSRSGAAARGWRLRRPDEEEPRGRAERAEGDRGILGRAAGDVSDEGLVSRIVAAAEQQLRPRRHPRQQRRHLRDRRHREDGRRRLRPRARGEPARTVPDRAPSCRA